MSSGYIPVNSGPLIIRATSNPSYNTYAVGNNDVPIPSNYVVTTGANGMLSFTNTPYISSLYVSTINGLPYNPTNGDVVYNGNVYNISASAVTVTDTNNGNDGNGGGSSLPSGTCYSDYIYWDGTTWQTGGNISPTSVHLGCKAGSTSQGLYTVAVGNSAGQANQETYAIAIGYQAGQVNQEQGAIAIGNAAGQISQNVNSIAIGGNAGQYSQNYGSVAIGLFAGQTLQSNWSVAIGRNAGSIIQGTQSVAIGDNAGQISQKQYSVAVGVNSGVYDQGSNSVAIGNSAGKFTQSDVAIAIGNTAGELSQGVGAVAIGDQAGQLSQGDYAIAIGSNAGKNNQPANTIILNATSISFDTLVSDATYITPIRALKTTSTLYYDPDTKEITYGDLPTSGATLGATEPTIPNGINYSDYLFWDGSSWKVPETTAIHIGTNAGLASQSEGAIAIGDGTGQVTQGEGAVAIGRFAGNNNQYKCAVAIGQESGKALQGTNAVALGFGAGFQGQGNNAIAIGTSAGSNAQGEYSIAVGYNAMVNASNANTIVLNASGNTLNPSNDSALYVAPIRPAQPTTSSLYYDPSTKEITYGLSGNGLPDGKNYSDYFFWDGTEWKVNSNSAVHIGYNAGLTGQLAESVAIGPSAGQYIQGAASVAIGNRAGTTNQAAQCIAIGNDAGSDSQGLFGIAIGNSAGNTSQGINAVAIGNMAGVNSQHSNTIILNATGVELNSGTAAATYIAPLRAITTTSTMYYDPNTKEVTYGDTPITGSGSSVPNGIDYSDYLYWDGTDWKVPTTDAVHIGKNAGFTSQGAASVAIGSNAAYTGQSDSAVAIGNMAGYNSQYPYAIAIGQESGKALQGTHAIALGFGSGYDGQDTGAIAIGAYAGLQDQKEYSIALGYNTMKTTSHQNAIVINATGNIVNSAGEGAFHVKPVRQIETLSSLYYNPASGEISYGSVPSGSSGGGTVSSAPSFWTTAASGDHIYSMNAGNVGIGTPTPTNKLEVVGNSKLVGDVYFAPANTTTSSAFKVELGNANLNVYKSTINSTNNTVIITNTGGNQLVLGTNNPSLFINGASHGNNNVGIGIPDPSERLAVSSSVLIRGANNGTSRMVLGPKSGGVNYDYCSIIESNNFFTNNFGSDLRFYTHSTMRDFGMPTEHMRIDSLGSVSIFNNFSTPDTDNLPMLSIQQPAGPYSTRSENRNHGIMLKDTGDTTNMFMGVDTATVAGVGSGYIQAVKRGVIKAPLVLNPQGGNVGIGKTSPQVALDVNGAVSCSNITLNSINGVIPRLDITTVGTSFLTLPGPTTYNYKCEYILIGGGGGGGGGVCRTDTEDGSGGGGGGGAEIKTGIFYATGGSRIDYTIGGGGIGGNANSDGADGGDSKLIFSGSNTEIVAIKGQRGYSGASSNGGWGGAGTYGGGGAGPIGTYSINGGSGTIINGVVGTGLNGGKGGAGAAGGAGLQSSYSDENGISQLFKRGGGGGGGGYGGGAGGIVASADTVAQHAKAYGGGGGGGYGGTRGWLSIVGGNAGGNGGNGCLTIVFTLIGNYATISAITRQPTPLNYSIAGGASWGQSTVYIPKNTIGVTVEMIGAAGYSGKTTNGVGGNGSYIYCSVSSSQIKELRGKYLLLNSGNNFSRASSITLQSSTNMVLVIAGGGGSGGNIGATVDIPTSKEGAGGNGGGANGNNTGFIGNLGGGRYISGANGQDAVVIDTSILPNQIYKGGGGKSGNDTVGGLAGDPSAPFGKTTIAGDAGQNPVENSIALGGDRKILDIGQARIGESGKGGEGYTGGGSGAIANNPINFGHMSAFGGGAGGTTYINTNYINFSSVISYGSSNNLPGDKLTGFGRPKYISDGLVGAYGFVKVDIATSC